MNILVVDENLTEINVFRQGIQPSVKQFIYNESLDINTIITHKVQVHHNNHIHHNKIRNIKFDIGQQFGHHHLAHECK